MIGKLKNLSPFIIIFLFGFVTHWQWFINDGIFTYGDTIWSTHSKVSELVDFPNLMSYSNLGSINIALSIFPIDFIQGLLVKCGIDKDLVFKLFFLFPIALITPLSSYLLAYYILGNKLASITASSIFTYCTPIIVGTTGILTSSVVVAISPLIILYFIKFFNEQKISNLYICLLITAIGISYDVRFVFLVYLILFLYFIYFSIINFKYKYIKELLDFKITWSLLFFLILLLFLNLYWIQILFLPSDLINQIETRSLWGSNLVSLTHSLFLNHSIWNNSTLIPFLHNPIPISSILIPFFFIIALININKKNNLLIFFILLSLLGIFLTKMDHFPFINIYEWLYINIPGFSFFRESSKFYFFIAIGYSIVISSLIISIKNSVLKYLFFIIINTLYLINSLPLINSEIDTMYVERHIPKDYQLLNEIINDDRDQFFRILFIPRYSKWGEDNKNRQRIDYLTLKNNNEIKKIEQLPFSEISLLSSNIFANFLNNLSIKYLVLPIEDKSNNDNFYEYYGSRDHWENFLEILSKKRSFKKINADFESLIVYENPYFKGKFRQNDYDLNNYKCSQFNNCSLHIDLNNQPIKLTYSMNYSNIYDIYIEKNNEDITKKYNVKHEMDNYGLNSFIISKNKNQNIEQNEKVMIKLQIKKEILKIQRILELLSLMTIIFIFYKILFRYK